MKKIFVFFFVAAFALTSCNFPATVTVMTLTPTLVPTQTPLPTNTVVPHTQTPTVAPTSTPLPEPTTVILPLAYKVSPGDTLYKISKLFGVPAGLIVYANNIQNPNLVYADQTIVIPNPSQAISNLNNSGKTIMVILSLQRMYVFENGMLLKEFLVSTGLPNTPTVQGNFQILDKLSSARMTGPGYDLPDVPWIMHFYQDYAFHGTYWHNNFGNPMSHGCVNMKTEEAKWLYDWADIGTPVKVLP